MDDSVATGFDDAEYEMAMVDGADGGSLESAFNLLKSVLDGIENRKAGGRHVSRQQYPFMCPSSGGHTGCKFNSFHYLAYKSET